MKKETLEKLVNDYCSKNKLSAPMDTKQIISYMMGEIEKDKSLQHDIALCAKMKREEEKRHVEKIKEIDQITRKIQNRCPHYEYTYFGDAAGGSGSINCCDLCGKEWK